MRVVIDARPLSQPQAGGFKSYVQALLGGLRERAESGLRREEILLYIDRPLPASVVGQLPPNAQLRMVSATRMKTDLLLFARQVRRDSPDIVMGTVNYLPVGLPHRIPRVVTIHDAMGIKAYPWDVGRPRNFRGRFINRYWSFLTRIAARVSKLVVTVSHGSQKELASTTGLPPDRFRIVYNGVIMRASEPILRDPATLLVIESPDPRKNAIAAYRALPEVCVRLPRPARLQIVCNGEVAERRVRGMLNDQTIASVPGLDIDLLVGLTDSQLSKAYARTGVFVWPSRFEGFGLPPLEAMTNGCAVVSSSAPVMPEVLGDVPVYANPDRPQEFADGIVRLVSDNGEVRLRGERGRVLAATFSCRRMADQTSDVWYEAVS